MSAFPTLVRGASPNGEDRYFLRDSLVAIDPLDPTRGTRNPYPSSFLAITMR